MASHVRGPQGPQEQNVRLVSVDGRHAELAFSGEATGAVAGQIEKVMLDPALQNVSEWTFDLSKVQKLDAVCASHSRDLF
ncbi:hypothetical protein [Streptomyces flavidovirens]|uniref:Uncharacterized protein n=1 Tax=Streptomyces flavidovirens TaxID=67298 RepID=A0ABW6RMH3_9ACTN